jgi:hypothetical protein
MGRGLVVILALICTAGVLHRESSLLARIESRIAFIVAADRLTNSNTEGSSLAPFLPNYLAYAKRNGIVVYFEPLIADTEKTFRGVISCPYTVYGEQKCVIVVDSQCGANCQLATLLHEFAHKGAPRLQTVGEAETFAETVAYLVMLDLGFDNSAVAMSYLHAIPEPARYRVLSQHEDAIRKLTDRLAKVGKA